MPIAEAQIDRSLELLLQVAREQEGVADELLASRSEYFSTAPEHPEERVAQRAMRRHAEWFLLERLSTSLGGVPADRLTDQFSSRAEPEEEEALSALLDSRAGIFEVTGVTEGQGVWVRDLAALGEYPLHEPEGSHVLEVGDLLVGRIFPVGESLHRISSASAHFRSPDLLRALTRDLENLRGDRTRMRLPQIQLERMFWSGEPAEVVDPVQEVRDLLTGAQVEEDDVEHILAMLASTPMNPRQVAQGGNDFVGEILDGLAFDTDVDLDQARRALLAAWPVLISSANAPPTPPAPAARKLNGHAAPPVDLEGAIEAFDRGRAEGRDISALFDELEEELDLPPDPKEQDRAFEAPDFPGVVGAMVEEFLWDVEREQGPKVAGDQAILRKLSRYGGHLGVFENVGARDLMTFAALWLPDRGELGCADDARRLIGALRSFCRWSEERHEVHLLTAFSEPLKELESSLPRIAEANRLRKVRPDRGEDEWFEIGETTDASATLNDRHGHACEVRIDPAMLRWLRPGDHLRAHRLPGGELAVFCCYPPQAAELRPTQ